MTEPVREPQDPREAQIQPQTYQAFMVCYFTTESRHFEGRTSGLRGLLLFIETNDLLPVGSPVTVEIPDSHDPSERRTASGQVVWICCKADQFNFAPGLGVRLSASPRSYRRPGPDMDRSMPPRSPGLFC